MTKVSRRSTVQLLAGMTLASALPPFAGAQDWPSKQPIRLVVPWPPGGVADFLGRLLAHGAVALTSTTVNALYIATAATPPALGATDVVVALLVGVPLSVAAAMVPALEASRSMVVTLPSPSVTLTSRFAAS